MIYRGDDKADKLVQFYLSLFSLARFIPLAKKVSLDTFETIIRPAGTPKGYCSGSDPYLENEQPVIREFLGELKPKLRSI